MKKICFNALIFLQYIKIIFSVIPVWKFDSSTQELLNQTGNFEHVYTVSSGNIWAHENGGLFALKRKIYKDNGEVKQQNMLYINDTYFADTDYDDIESMYRHKDDSYFVCPKGRSHVIIYKINNGEDHYEFRIDDEFDENGNWDLKCYFQYYEKYLFITYLNYEAKVYQYNFINDNIFHSEKYHGGIYAYSWSIGSEHNPDKVMFAIINNGNSEYLFRYLDFYVPEMVNYQDTQPFYITNKNNIKLTDLKSKNQVYFTKDIDPTFYYFINYNDENDFESGFNKKSINNLAYNINYDIESITNATSPFIFYENITINEIKFISYTRFVYYNISIKDKNNEKTDNFYYGIIDITLNKIIFNTNEKLIEFKPYKMGSMLAITSENAYRICPYAKAQSGWLECEEDECGSRGTVIDSTGRNYCGTACPDGKFTIRPDNICIDKCDENLYYIDNDKKECKLCKDINKDKNFKITNLKEAGCLPDKPNNSYFKNERLSLVACYEGFNYLENNNCVEKCSDNYFLEEGKHICQKCSDDCQTCELNSDHCTSCRAGEYLDSNKCTKCNNNCKTCLKEDNSIKCLSCDKESNFRLLFNNSCLDECPLNFTLSKDNTTCISKEESNKKEEDKNIETTSFVHYLFITLTFALLIIILFIFYKRTCSGDKKLYESLVSGINSELENKELY